MEDVQEVTQLVHAKFKQGTRVIRVIRFANENGRKKHTQLGTVFGVCSCAKGEEGTR